MTAKLGDVAKLAEVSVTTVSRVINNYGSLSQKTKDKVFAAMRELNYQPNAMARSLQGKSSRFIGLIFPNLTVPFFAELVETLESKLFELDYKTIIASAADNPQKEKQYLQMLAANQVEGIISGSHNLGLKDYNNINLPIVSFDRYLGPDIPIVSSDNFAGGRLAANYLLNHHKKHIALITDDDESGSPTVRRAQGFLEVANQANQLITVETFSFPDNRYTETKKLAAFKSIFKPGKFDGAFTNNDQTALLVNQAAKSNGLKLPENLLVVGYDGSQFTQLYLPFLTTIIQPTDPIADELIDTVIQRIGAPTKFTSNKNPLPVYLRVGK